MNAEIVRRLRDSFLADRDRTTLVAEALMESLDEAVIAKILKIRVLDRADDELADMAREDSLIERENEGGKKS